MKALAIIRLPFSILNPFDPCGPPEPFAIMVREYFPRPLDSAVYRTNANTRSFLGDCIDFVMELRRNGLSTRIPAHSIHLGKESGDATSQGKECVDGVTEFLENECKRKNISRLVDFDPINIQRAMDPTDGFAPILVDFNCYRSEKKFNSVLLVG